MAPHEDIINKQIMILSDLSTAIDDERRKTGTSFIAAAEKTRYINQALQALSNNNDFYEQETTNNFSYVPGTSTYTINALSAIAPNHKTKDSVISITATSSTTKFFERINPETFPHLTTGNYFAIAGRDLWVMHDGVSGDTLTTRYISNYVGYTSGATLSASLTASTDEPLQDMDPEAIIAYALYKIFKKEGKKDDWQEAKHRYDEILKTLQQDSKYHRANVYDRMTFESGYNTDWVRRI